MSVCICVCFSSCIYEDVSVVVSTNLHLRSNQWSIPVRHRVYGIIFGDCQILLTSPMMQPAARLEYSKHVCNCLRTTIGLCFPFWKEGILRGENDGKNDGPFINYFFTT